MTAPPRPPAPPALPALPLLPSPPLSALTGAEIFVKYENLQVTNSFKERGACVKLAALSAEQRRRGVIAMSAGNHAQAVAYHARRLAIPATIVMPETTPFVKIKATEALGAMVVLDNTWSAGVYFDAFAHGVDVTMQALTKYVGGHSDLLLGSITVRDKAAYKRLGSTHQLVGCAASPDDCSLALRGIKTLAVRLKALEEAALALARWLAQRPEIELVLHPALPSCPGHEFWKRDFIGSTGLFSIVFQRQFTKPQVLAFVDALELFEIGYSWAGVTSLAVAYDFHSTQSRPDYGHRIVRLNIGLEDVDDLKADLARALESMK